MVAYCCKGVLSPSKELGEEQLVSLDIRCGTQELWVVASLSRNVALGALFPALSSEHPLG